MPEIRLVSGKKIGDKNRPYFVAEMNSSHNGKLETARKMIDAAIECGCDAVKFQSWSAESLYCADYYKENPIAQRMVKKFAMAEETLKVLAKDCRDHGIAFSSTPYSKTEVDFLVSIQAEYIKVSSMDLNNLPFLEYIGRQGFPVILSTGMGTMEEIHLAVRTIEETGNRNIGILHCVSIYPVRPEDVNLNNIRMLQQEFPEYPIGYSDHTLGPETAHAAVALGAAMIEKHFTLDNSRIGWDNQMAAEPFAMKELVETSSKIYSAMGSYERVVSLEEQEQRKKMRRSIVASRQLEAGYPLSVEDLDAKRPGDGISPDNYKMLVGKRLNRRVNRDEIIREQDLYD
ncbi:MAG: N-acylneuraminate-9-phosphate synthase [Lachnospiraceae bacterium]|nr:N-acylneuraminate-9-phosphate synthase [Lachnospiraceae bacterium]